MKRIALALLLALVLSAAALADSMADIIPDSSAWGLSQEDFQKAGRHGFKPCSIGSRKGLTASGLEVEGYPMSAYCVFGENMWTASGMMYAGLSKQAYILSGSRSEDEVRECHATLVVAMMGVLGEPDAAGDAVYTWNRQGFKVEIGIGRFSNYTGSQDLTAAVIFTGVDIPKPTLEPVATAAPAAKPAPSARVKYKKLDWEGLNSSPEKFKGTYVTFTGQVLQVMKSFSSYDLRVATRGGYDDVVFVVVPVDSVEGPSILAEDKITVYGMCDGMESYSTILGLRASLPKITASRVILN